jgi:hypothetical protein
MSPVLRGSGEILRRFLRIRMPVDDANAGPAATTEEAMTELVLTNHPR